MKNKKIINIYNETKRLVFNTIQVMKDGDSKEKAFCEGMKESFHYLESIIKDLGIEIK